MRISGRVTREGEGAAYRRAVTRRASTTNASEAPLRKHAVAKSGQICLAQFCGKDRTSSRSDFASASDSPASAFGANRGRATTEVPKAAKIAKAARDYIICAGPVD